MFAQGTKIRSFNPKGYKLVPMQIKKDQYLGPVDENLDLRHFRLEPEQPYRNKSERKEIFVKLKKKIEIKEALLEAKQMFCECR